MIRVLLVDDDPTCREGLRQLLSLADDLEVVGEASNAQDAFKIGHAVGPDIVVIDADLPSASCVEAMLKLSGAEATPEQHPSFICLAVYPDQHDAAIQAGASCFLRKDGSPRELIEAIRSAAHARGPRVPITPDGVRPRAPLGS